uniref:hypothetical protein n=1 Tax=Paraburkholderia guartelaensis TaxID=2546446 RepID=UPI002AB7679E
MRAPGAGHIGHTETYQMRWLPSDGLRAYPILSRLTVSGRYDPLGFAPLATLLLRNRPQELS